MNFKKFISGVSALTIAASAFAGLAVTASASEYSSPYTLATGEVISDVYIGTAVTEDNVTTSVTPESFTSGGYTATGISNFYTRDSGFAEVDASKNIYATGYGINIPVAANSEEKHDFTTPITSGKLILRGDIVNAQRNEFVRIYGQNADEEVTVFSITGPNSNYGAWTINVGGSTVSESKNSKWERGYALTIDYVVVDLSAKTVSYKYDGIAASANNNATHNNTVSISGLTEITGISIGNSNGSKSGTSPTFDDVAMYHVVTPVAAGPLTVNFKNGSDTVATMNPSTSGAYAGYSFDYFVPAYVEGTDGKLYATTSPYNRSVALNADPTTTTYADVDVTLYTANKHQFVDFTNTPIGDNGKDIRALNFSSGAARTGASGDEISALTVAEDGIYTIKVHGGAHSTDNARNGELRVNSVKIGNVTYTNYGGTINTFDNIELHKDDVLGVTIGRGQSSALDYVLIEKTGDIPAGPSAEVTEVSYNKYDANETASLTDESITAAKIYVTVTGSIDTLGLRYYDAEAAAWTDAEYVQNFEGLTDTDIVLGAIVPGLVELSTSSFDAVIE